MEKVSRKQKTIINSVIEIGSYLLTTLFNLILRLVLIRTIGVEFLGLNGLFASIVAIFSLADLGFSSVMWFFLYEPVAKNDIEKIKSIVGFAKKVYSIVAMIILGCTIAVVPILPLWVKTTVPMAKTQLYFVLFALSVVVSYLIMYKSILLGAEQRDYIDKIFTIVSTIVTTSLQIIALVCLKSFTIFLTIKIVVTLIRNLFLNIYTNKQYPFLKDKSIAKLSHEEKSDMKKKIFALSCHKIGAVTANSIDNIILSAFIGITVVGYYSNYSLIFSAVATLAVKFINGSCASVGNLWVTEKTEKVEDVYNKVSFLQFWLISVCFVMLFCLAESFISLFFGTTFKLGQQVVILSVVIFYISKINLTVSVFKDSKGLFQRDKYRPIIEALINILASLIGVKLFGIYGILLGTILSYLATFWVEPKILYNHGFNKSSKKYFVQFLLRSILIVLITGVTFVICYNIPDTILGFILKVGISFSIPNLTLLLLFRKDHRFLYYFNMLKSKLFKRKNQIND